MTVKQKKLVNPNYGISLCKFRWTTCFGLSYDHHQVRNSSYGPDDGHMNDPNMYSNKFTLIHFIIWFNKFVVFDGHIGNVN
jgi:hypothetical protein